MKIVLPRSLGCFPESTLLPNGWDSRWPTDKHGVMSVAERWYEPSRVAVNDERIATLPLGTIVPPQHTNLTITPSDNNPSALVNAMAYSLAHNSINHMFWSLDEQGRFQRYEHNGVVGATLMTQRFAAAWNDTRSPLQRVARQGIPMTEEDVVTMFGSIPDPRGRARLLNEVLTSPDLNRWSDHLADVARQNGIFDTTHAAGLSAAFPEAYGDDVLKKSQLAISAAWRNAREHGQSPGCDLTAFADYQVPNVLRALGLIDYSPALAAHIDAYRLIPEHSVDERAIRAASILAVEQLAHQQNVNVADVDYWLWSKRKEPTTPFHLTITTAY